MENPAQSPAIMAALAARTQGSEPTPALSQQTQPGASVPPPPMAPSQMTSALPAGMNQSNKPGEEPKSEKQMVLKALIQQLTHENKRETPPEASQGLPMGGGMGPMTNRPSLAQIYQQTAGAM
jgi:hypothetical protein